MSRAVDVVVIGAGIAGLSAAYALRCRGANVLLLERSHRVGGMIESERTADGFLIEHGPDGILSSKLAGMHMVRALDLESALIRGGRAPRRAFVGTAADRLEKVPEGLFRFERKAIFGLLASRLLSMRGKARLFSEPFVARGNPEEESVAEFFTRRLGVEVAEQVVEPLLRGVYGAPTSRLGMAETMPTVSAMELDRGSLTAALVAARGSTTGAGLVSLRAGMGSMVAALATRLSDAIRLSTPVEGIEHRPGGVFEVDAGARGRLLTRGVILACPTWAAAPIVESLSPALAASLGEIEYSPADVVSMGFHRRDVPHPLDGTGFVVSPRAGRATVGCTWSSEKWPERAPDNHVLLRAISSTPDASDEEVVERARQDIRAYLGVEAAPLLTSLRRRRAALPVHGVRHRARVARARQQAAELGAVALAGNAYAGMGVPDCIASGLQAAAMMPPPSSLGSERAC